MLASGAASEAAKEGYPSVAFSGKSEDEESYTAYEKASKSKSGATVAASVYANLTHSFVQALLAKPFGAPGSKNAILPPNITLNVNFPKPKGTCAEQPSLKFAMTRINNATKGTPPDVANPCGERGPVSGNQWLPVEKEVIKNSSTKSTPCWATVSVMNATTKGDVDAVTQAYVVDRLGSFLC